MTERGGRDRGRVLLQGGTESGGRGSCTFMLHLLGMRDRLRVCVLLRQGDESLLLLVLQDPSASSSCGPYILARRRLRPVLLEGILRLLRIEQLSVRHARTRGYGLSRLESVRRPSGKRSAASLVGCQSARGDGSCGSCESTRATRG